MKLYTHLNFGGNCEKALLFYQENLAGKISFLLKQSQIESISARTGSEDAVVHARMNIAGVELIANDVPRDRFQPIRSSYLYLELDSTEDADRTYQLLSDGGSVAIPMAETFFAQRFAQLRDKFGVLWTVLCRKG